MDIGPGASIWFGCVLRGDVNRIRVGADTNLQVGAFVGMSTVVVDQAVVEPGGMVAAGALVTSRKIVKSGELWGGRPARFMRAMTEREIADIAYQASHYGKLAGSCLAKRAARG